MSYAYDPNEDRIVKEVRDRPQAPDSENGARTKKIGPLDEKNLLEGDLRAGNKATEEYDATPRRRQEIMQLIEEIETNALGLEHRRELMDVGQWHIYQFEYYAGHHHHNETRWWAHLGLDRLLIAIMAIAETLLAYVGFKLAVPEIGASKDAIVHFIATQGPWIAATAIGIASAGAQFAIGRQLARANRAVLSDPVTGDSR